MIDKKTLALFFGLIVLVVFIYFLSKTTDLKRFFSFPGDFSASPSASISSPENQGRSNFSDLLESPTPSPEPPTPTTTL
ncbi:hypothetical protein A2W14_04550 [Candidatus Gottesmanbacteria bacterium RBG_16_37_8]|uniref:Uncharacterized protein n=1 Tax=Candidatus Gottesmanbacteria bacterium RBG_16_37_8 TaxID=1798371 RepID=A0A1F5YSD7_9BACT|nr:MAG: hypothetical protein A2W14_04550 [Candidatus Gottesmanbacteria bacterium RBG_16_37_8]